MKKMKASPGYEALGKQEYNLQSSESMGKSRESMYLMGQRRSLVPSRNFWGEKLEEGQCNEHSLLSNQLYQAPCISAHITFRDHNIKTE